MIPGVMGWSVQVLPPGHSLTRALAELVLAELPARAGIADGSGVLVVVPAARARRSFERHLSGLARERGLAAIAPVTLTPGELASRFVVPRAPRLGALGIRASWRAALRACPGASVLFPHLAPGEEPDDAAAEALAARVMALHRDASSAGLTLAEVGGRVGAQDSARARWDALAALEAARARIRGDAGVADPASEACAAARAGDVRPGSIERAFVLMADPEPLHRALLGALESKGVRVTVTVHAAGDAIPAPLDDLGFPDHAAWSRVRVDAGQDRIAPAGAPADQAAAVMDWLGSLPAPRRSCDLGIAVPDPQVAAEVASLLPAWGVRVTPPPGRTAAESSVGLLVSALAGWVGSRSCEALKELAGHPDVARLLERDGLRDAPVSVADFAASSGARSVPHRVDHPAMARVAGIVASIDRLLGALAGSTDAREAASGLRAVLDALVRPGSPASLEAARAVRDAIDELESLPEAIAGGVDAAAAMRLVHARIASQSLPADGPADGIELLGWLDAGIDDAPCLAITGMNEGIVPEGLVVDPWLPDSAREPLGMACARRRQARDAWIMHGLLSRKRSVLLVTGRTSAEGEPLRPSRLVLGVRGQALAERVAWLVDPRTPRASAARRSAAAPTHGAFVPRPVPEGASPITTISVTSFRDWLQSPTLFRLRRDPRTRLDNAREQGGEMDAMGFGSFVHRALELWGAEAALRTEAGEPPETDERALADALMAHFDAAREERFVPALRGSFEVQLAIARERVRAFARAQARWASQGWRVRHVELTFGTHEGSVPAPAVGATSIRLTGRIDRVDVHPDAGHAALDYKTSPEPTDPGPQHRNSNGRWLDLQLPLYRVLLRSVGIDVPPHRLGYVSLPSNPSLTGFRLASSWDEAFAAAAEEEAERIARLVEAGDFADDTGWTPRPDDALAAAWCVGMRGLARGATP
jgi:ATP-dependent helicase/nuclease subunit B